MNSIMKIKEGRLNIYMLMLALFPVFNLYYFGSTSFYLPQVITVLLFGISLFNHRPTNLIIPWTYLLCWAYVAFHDIFFVSPFKFTKLLPGGINFFLFSIGWILFARNFDLNKLRKYVFYVFAIAALLFFYQNVAYYVLGQGTSVILPISNHLNYGDFTFSELQVHQKTHFAGRFSSIFAEPSYWAQYCVVALCLELFSEENRIKLFSGKALLIAAVLLAIQSGVGVLCLGLLLLIKLYQIIFINKDASKVRYLILLLPVVCYAAYVYVSSDIGQALVERGNNISSVQGAGGRSSFLRLFYGWEYLASQPLDTLFFGSNEFIGISSDDESFFNCASYFTLMHGILGFSLLVLFYFSSARKNGLLSAVAALTLLSISMMEAIYLSPIMLLLTVVVVASQKTIQKVTL